MKFAHPAAAVLLFAASAAQAQDPGQRAFLQCRACHNVAKGAPDLVGPNLNGMFGRKAGSKPGYNYSAALKNAGFIWTDDKLAAWLADPRGFLKGNKMVFMGVKDPAARKALIAYLKGATK